MITFGKTEYTAMILLFYTGWVLLVILFQLIPVRRLFGRLPFYLCGLLPDWQLFGSRPVNGDYRVYYRTRVRKRATFTAWQPLPPVRKGPAAGSLFFHPQGRVILGLRDICMETCLSQTAQNVYYQILLQHIIGTLREREPDGECQLQFQICVTDTPLLNPLFRSHVHSL